MTNKRFTQDQIYQVLQDYENGMPIPKLIEKYHISQATFYNWKAKYGDTVLNDPHEIQKLKDDNERLKRMFVDISLENQKLKALLQKYEEAHRRT